MNPQNNQLNTTELWQQPSPQLMPNQPPKKRKISWLRYVLLLLLLLIILTLSYFFGPMTYNNIVTSLNRSSQENTLKSLASYGSNITAPDLQKLNKTDAFYGVFANAAQQNITTITSNFLTSQSPTDYARQGSNLRQVGFNYKTKAFSYADAAYDYGSTQPGSMNICIGSQEYSYLRDFSEDGWTKTDASLTSCNDLATLSLSGLADGLNTGGLTKSQAQTFTDSLRNTKGLISVNDATLATISGKPLIRFDVTVNRLITEGFSNPLGTQYFIWALKDTNIDLGSWPYSTIGAGADGVHMAYYVDPATQLPVYSQIRTTDILDASGKPESDQSYDYVHAEYQFGGSLPTPNPKTFNGLKLLWPVDTKV